MSVVSFLAFAVPDNVVRERAVTYEPQVPRDTKYILLWTPQYCDNCAPFDSFGRGRYAFKRAHCQHQNCYITSNRTLLGDYTNFDAILFNGRSMLGLNKNELPQRRLPKQTYVFVQLESADRFPVCSHFYDSFFNKTFTYKLKSNYPWPYFNLLFKNGSVAAPKLHVDWPEHGRLESAGEELAGRWGNKSKLAAWFVSNCNSRNNREQFVRDLQKELQRHNQKIDTYGKCGTLKCPRNSALCDRYLEEDYYFYMSLENSNSEDYVTEKLLTPLLHHTVPVVLGAADYDRFLPPGSYLHGRKLGPAKLAEEMVKIMQNATLYANMFRWRRHYDVVRTWPPPLCRLCEDLHDRASEAQQYAHFREWWFPNYNKRC